MDEPRTTSTNDVSASDQAALPNKSEGETTTPISFAIPKVVPRAIRPKTAIERAEKKLQRNLPRYITKMEDLAQGVTMLEVKDGKERIYTKPPDRAALEYLIDRGMGKTPQRFEMTGADGGPVEVLPWLPAGVSVPVIEGEARELLPEGQEEG